MDPDAFGMLSGVGREMGVLDGGPPAHVEGAVSGVWHAPFTPLV